MATVYYIVDWNKMYIEESKLNAELLEALKAIPMDCPHTWPHLQACWVCKAKAAINRAEGRKG